MDRPTGRVIRRYEHAAPGDLVHVDVKKLGKIPPGGGRRIHGRETAHRSARAKRQRVGYSFVHSIVDDHSRIAHSEVHDDEKGRHRHRVLRPSTPTLHATRHRHQGSTRQRDPRGSATYDIVARLGGDEFAVLLSGLSAADPAVGVASQMLDRLQSASFEVGGVALAIEASIGIARIPTHGCDVDVLSRRGDIAMYRATRTGTAVAVYDETAIPRDRRTHPARRTASCDRPRRTRMHYQPKPISPTATSPASKRSSDEKGLAGTRSSEIRVVHLSP